MALNLEEFGVIKKDKRGIDYFYSPETHIEIKVEAIRPFRGKVKRFAPMLPWYEVEVDTLPQAFLIHNNWISSFGKLREGEEIEGVIHTRHMLGWVAWYVRRVQPEGVVAV
jgi:hypothetical protein